MMTTEELKETLVEGGFDDAIVFENPDFIEAVVGVSIDGRVIYCYDKMVESLKENDGMTEIEAIDFIEYNTIRAIPYIGEKAPIIFYSL